jgi:hypothetical protein
METTKVAALDLQAALVPLPDKSSASLQRVAAVPCPIHHLQRCSYQEALRQMVEISRKHAIATESRAVREDR